MATKTSTATAPSSNGHLHVPIDSMTVEQVLAGCRTIVAHVASGALTFGAGRNNDHSRDVKRLFEKDLAKALHDPYEVFAVLSKVRAEVNSDNVTFQGAQGHIDGVRALMYKTRLGALRYNVRPKAELDSSSTPMPAQRTAVNA